MPSQQSRVGRLVGEMIHSLRVVQLATVNTYTLKYAVLVMVGRWHDFAYAAARRQETAGNKSKGIARRW